MSALRKNNLTKLILNHYKLSGSQHYFAKCHFSNTNEEKQLNLLNEPMAGVQPGSFLNPFKPLANMFRAVWYRYKYDNSFDPGQTLADSTRKVI